MFKLPAIFGLLVPCALVLVLAGEATPTALADDLNTESVSDMSENVLKRDLQYGRVRILNIESDFILPYSSNTYFARLYYFPKNLKAVEFRDSMLAERFYEEEKKLSSPIHCIRKEIAEFAPPSGLNMVKAPGTLVNLTSEPGFSLKQGGYLKLYLKVPLQDAKLVRIYMAKKGNLIKTFLIDKNGEKVLFDQIFIEAKRIFGRPNVLRGIAEISFMREGKTVQELY